MKELIAFRSVDLEGDVWSEEAFLFESQEDVEKFFKVDNKDFANIYDPEREGFENFEVHKSEIVGLIFKITFSTSYAGDVKILEMNKGFLI